MMFQRTLLAVSFFLLSVSFGYAQSGASSAYSTFSRSTRSARSQILNRPTVSPYLKLVNGGTTSGNFGNIQPIYQTQVRPALEARQQNFQQQEQIQQIQSQLNQVRAQYTRPNSGLMQTGHPTRFMTYSHYYPGMR